MAKEIVGSCKSGSSPANGHGEETEKKSVINGKSSGMEGVVQCEEAAADKSICEVFGNLSVGSPVVREEKVANGSDNFQDGGEGVKTDPKRVLPISKDKNVGFKFDSDQSMKDAKFTFTLKQKEEVTCGDSKKSEVTEVDKANLMKSLGSSNANEETEILEDEEDEGADREDGKPKPVERGDLPVEALIFEYRAKLFRFDNEKKEWKERGIGKIIMVQSLEDAMACRVVMWVDGNGRIACNFRLYPELSTSLLQNNPKVACWNAYDMSENTPKWETFACRFAKPEECSSFRTALEQYATAPPTCITVTIKDDVCPTSAVANEESIGETNCAGCVGCKPENYEFENHSRVRSKPKTVEVIDINLDADSCTEKPRSMSFAEYLQKDF